MSGPKITWRGAGMANEYEKLLGATTTATTGPPSSFTLADLLRVKAVIDAIPPDPLPPWMAAQGFDPERGGILVLPESMRADWGPWPPGYIRFSANAPAPLLCWNVCGR